MQNRNRLTYIGYGIKRQTIVYKIDKQQGYIIQHRELQPLSFFFSSHCLITTFNGEYNL